MGFIEHEIKKDVKNSILVT